MEIRSSSSVDLSHVDVLVKFEHLLCHLSLQFAKSFEVVDGHKIFQVLPNRFLKTNLVFFRVCFNLKIFIIATQSGYNHIKILGTN